MSFRVTAVQAMLLQLALLLWIIQTIRDVMAFFV